MKQVKPMKPRYRQRIRLEAHVIFTNGSQTGEGRVLDLTSPGCLIESAGIAVPKGQSLQLNISVSSETRSLMVTLGVVRWTNGKHFGVEFIKMDQSNRLVLNDMLSQHFLDTASVRSIRNSFSDPSGGHNWHLETYSKFEKG